MNIFKDVVNIKKIDLSNNQLISLSENLFKDLHNLKKLHLGNNPISKSLPNYVKQLLRSSNPACNIDIKDKCTIS